MRQKGSFGGTASSFIIIGVLGIVLLLGCGFAIRQLLTRNQQPAVKSPPAVSVERPVEKEREKPLSSHDVSRLHASSRDESVRSAQGVQLPQSGVGMVVVNVIVLCGLTMTIAYYAMSRRMLPKF